MTASEISPRPPNSDKTSEPPLSLPPLLAGLAAVVVLFDNCFWHASALGLSEAVFFGGLTAIILWLRKRQTRPRISRTWLLLLMGTAGAATIQTGTVNTALFLTLLIAVAGDTYFTERTSLWDRGLLQISALVRAPGRVFWLAARMLEAGWKTKAGFAVRFLSLVALVLPALILVLIFGTLLGAGNAVFAYWTSSLFDWLWSLLALDPVRIFVWCLVAFSALPFLRPASLRTHKWRWIHGLPRFPEIVPKTAAYFGSALVLGSLNVLFLAANAADAIFLWNGHRLPPDVGYSAFVHQGVNTLTFTVLPSAGVLSAIFQQAAAVTTRRSLRVLAYAWIAQNIFLLVSIALRLKLYIEAYDMSVERLGVIIFLALAAINYLLLTIKIQREKSLSWQLGSSLIALFGVLYLTQFLNLAGWAADYNVTVWAKDRSRNMDVEYLKKLGPAAWPALARAHQVSPQDSAITLAWAAAPAQANRL